jgi:hypothetical protein
MLNERDFSVDREFSWDKYWNKDFVRDAILAPFQGKPKLAELVDYLWAADRRLVQKTTVIDDLWKGLLGGSIIFKNNPLGPYVKRIRSSLPESVGLYTLTYWDQLILCPKIRDREVFLPDFQPKIDACPPEAQPLARWLWTVQVGEFELTFRAGQEEMRTIKALSENFPNSLNQFDLVANLNKTIPIQDIGYFLRPIIDRSRKTLSKYPGPERFNIANGRGGYYRLVRQNASN